MSVFVSHAISPWHKWLFKKNKFGVVFGNVSGNSCRQKLKLFLRNLSLKFLKIIKFHTLIVMLHNLSWSYQGLFLGRFKSLSILFFNFFKIVFFPDNISISIGMESFKGCAIIVQLVKHFLKYNLRVDIYDIF